MENFLCLSLSLQTREVVTRCSTGCCWIALSSRWSCRTTKVSTPTSHHWRILTWRMLSGCESAGFPLNTLTHEWVHGTDYLAEECVFAEDLKAMCSAVFKLRKTITGVFPVDTVVNYVGHPFCRLVNENEVKQWKEQAEKMRKGAYDYELLKYKWIKGVSWAHWVTLPSQSTTSCSRSLRRRSVNVTRRLRRKRTWCRRSTRWKRSWKRRAPSTRMSSSKWPNSLHDCTNSALYVVLYTFTGSLYKNLKIKPDGIFSCGGPEQSVSSHKGQIKLHIIIPLLVNTLQMIKYVWNWRWTKLYFSTLDKNQKSKNRNTSISSHIDLLLYVDAFPVW